MLRCISKPLTLRQMKNIADKDNYIEAIIHMDLEEFIDNDLEGCLDIMSQKLTGGDILQDISYQIVPSGEAAAENNIIYLKVTGCISGILECEEEEEEQEDV